MARRSNCFFYAIRMWWMYGGYLAFRPSRNITGIHWLWSPDLETWYQYAPKEPKHSLLAAAVHKIWYEGEIKIGDKDGLKKIPSRPFRDDFPRLADTITAVSVLAASVAALFWTYHYIILFPTR